jgi:hypothetical protein
MTSPPPRTYINMFCRFFLIRFVFSNFKYRARICKSFKEPRNRFPAWRAGTTTLLVVPARQVAQAGAIDSSESIHGLHERLQIRAL